MRSRMVAPAALAAVLLAATAACGGGGGGKKDDDASGSVTLWMYPVIADPAAGKAFWDRTARDFTKANPKIKVKVELQPWANRDEKIATAIAANKGPDLVLLIPDQIPQYVSNRTLAPVDDAISSVRKDFVPSSLQAQTVGGKLYAVPLYNTIATTVCNKKLLQQAGVSAPPASWDQVKSDASAFTAKGLSVLDYSAAAEATENLNFYPLLWQAGGSVFAKDGRTVAFNSDAGVRALTFLVDLYKSGGVPHGALNNSNVVEGHPLGNQQVACGYTVQLSDARTLAKLWGADNVQVAMPLKGRKQAGFGIAGGVALTRKAAHPAAAKKFLTYLASPAVMKELNTLAGYVPPRTSVKVSGDALYTQFAKALPYVHPSENNVAARQVMAALAPEIQAALQGQKSPKQALDDAAKAGNDLISRTR